MEPIEPVLPVEEEQLPPQPTCNNCFQPIHESDRFCSHCGSVRVEVPEAYSEENFVSAAKPVAAFYLIFLIICIVAHKIDAFEEYSYMVWIEVTLSVFTIIFAASRWHDIRPLFSFRNIKLAPLLGYSIMAVGMALLVNVGADLINDKFFHGSGSYIIPYLGYRYAGIIFILSLAVHPAIFEELGFRGYVFNSVREFAGPASAIAISSMSFAIMHQNLISLIWLVPFAFWLGHLRNKYDTLWYGIAAHFAFNCTTAVTEMIEYGVYPFN